MAYQYKKLSEVEMHENPSSPNILVEEGGEVVRVPASNLTTSGSKVQADWNETNEDSPAFILNKPDLGSIGGGDSAGSTVLYHGSSASIYVDENHSQIADYGNIYNDFIAGNRVLVKNDNNGAVVELLGVYYTASTGSEYVSLVMLDRMSLEGGSPAITVHQSSTTTSLNTIEPSKVSADTVVYNSSSAASGTNSNLYIASTGERCSAAVAQADLNANKRILIHYSSDESGWNIATYAVIGSYTGSDGYLRLILVEPAGTSLRTLTFYAN